MVIFNLKNEKKLWKWYQFQSKYNQIICHMFTELKEPILLLNTHFTSRVAEESQERP